ncbi:MAG: hypothetical protein JO101_11855 [Candidatus Eremiobacteraeota bacterium]|nr:hypothetical protein [Candidatus Eremiobacteraeota bacterium]
MRVGVAILAALVCGVAFAPAFAADTTAAQPPLRRLVYDVAYSSTASTDTETSGATVRRRGGFAALPGPEQTRQMIAHQRETVQIDVVAVTGDGGLVVDASVDGADRHAPPTRIGIYRDGSLTYDPAATVMEEERRLCSMLRRDAFDHELAPGVEWKEPIEEPLAKGMIEYRVVRTEGRRAQLEINRDINVTGASPYDESSRMVTDYDPALLAPQRAVIQMRVRREPSFSQVLTIDTRIEINLQSDTYRDKAAASRN